MAWYNPFSWSLTEGPVAWGEQWLIEKQTQAGDAFDYVEEKAAAIPKAAGTYIESVTKPLIFPLIIIAVIGLLLFLLIGRLQAISIGAAPGGR